MVSNSPHARVLGLFQGVRNASDRAAAYQDVLVNRQERVDSADIQLFFSEHLYLNDVIRLFADVIRSLLGRNYDEEPFYAALSDFVFDSSLLEGDEERIAVFLLTLIDIRLPYHHFGNCVMSDDRFGELTQQYEREVTMLRQLSLRSFPQKTEEAAAILEIVDSIQDGDARVVCMAQYLDGLRNPPANGSGMSGFVG